MNTQTTRGVHAAAPGAAMALAISCIVNFIPNYAQYQASPFGAQLMETLAIDQGQFSLLFTAPMIPAIFLSIVAGLFIDKIGPKRVIAVALVATTAGCALRMVATDYALMMICTALTGLTACFLTSGAAKILAGYYGAEGVGSKMGILMAASTLGMTVALATTTMLGSVSAAFTVSTVLSVVAAVLWIFLLKDPGDVASEEQGSSGPTIVECLKVALRSPNLWFVAFALAFVLGGNVVMGSMTPTALGTRGVDAGMSGIITSLYTLGNLVGCFTAPFFVKLLNGRQKPVLLVYAALAAVGVAWAWTPSEPIVTALCMFLTGNFVGGIIPMCFAMPVQFEEIGPVYAGTAGGVLTTVQVLGAIFLPSYVFAPIAAGDYSVTFLLGGASLIVAGVFLLLAKIR